MRIKRYRHAPLLSGFLLASIIALPATGQARANSALLPAPIGRIGILPPVPNVLPAPDASLYTTYSLASNYTTLNWDVCGYRRDSFGCYGSGSLGPFGHVGAAIEGNETVNGNTVTRKIYVVDDGAGTGSSVTLYAYTKTDVLTSTGDTVTVNLTNAVGLPLTGGSLTKTFIAGDDGFLYIGTSRSTAPVQVQESNLAYGYAGGFSPPIIDSSVTANKYGYVTATNGNDNGFSGFYVFDPTGHYTVDGGGGDFMLGTLNGISTADGNLVTAGVRPDRAARMKVRFKKAAPRNTSYPANATPPPDSTLFTTYTFWDSYTALDWVVCGSTEYTEGCYASGHLTGFGHVGAAIEGNEVVSGNTVTRNLYVVDDAAAGGNGVTLSVYTKTDSLTLAGDSVTVNLTNSIALPLTGGSNAKTYIAGDHGFLYVGSSQNQFAVQVQESNLSYKEIAGSSSAPNVSSITADKYGYVTITSSDKNGSGSYQVYGTTGYPIENDDGGAFMLGTMNGISTGDGNITSARGYATRLKTSFTSIAP